VPFFIRAGKRLPVTQTEVRLIFTRPPRLRFIPIDRKHQPDPSQIVVKIDPSTGLRVILDAHRGDQRAAAPVHLDLEFAEEGGEGPRPYEVLLRAAVAGDSTYFLRQDMVEETWRIMEPLLDNAPEVKSYEPGTWGPDEANDLVKGYGGWHGPWVDEDPDGRGDK
jgi:glucose-6-phosphate 1-dehydrogenase